MLKLIKNGVIITNSNNPLQIIKNITLTVLGCGAPPLRLVAYCIVAGALIATSVASPNPVIMSSAIHIISDIYNNY